MKVKIGTHELEAKQVRLEFAKNPDDQTKNLFMFNIFFDETAVDFEQLVSIITVKENLDSIVYEENGREVTMTGYSNILKCSKMVNASSTELELTVTKETL